MKQDSHVVVKEPIVRANAHCASFTFNLTPHLLLPVTCAVGVYTRSPMRGAFMICYGQPLHSPGFAGNILCLGPHDGSDEEAFVPTTHHLRIQWSNLPPKASAELPRHVALRRAHSHLGDVLLVCSSRARSSSESSPWTGAWSERAFKQRQAKHCLAEVSIAVDNSVVRARGCMVVRSTAQLKVPRCPLAFC